MTPGSLQHLLSECEKEAIHIPGRIQPFGVLMTADPETLVIQNLSENCLKLWDRHSFALLGRCLSEFMSEQAFSALRAHVAALSHREQMPLRIMLTFDEFIRREWDMTAHLCDGVLYMEWEIAGSGSAPFEAAAFPRHVQQAVHALQAAQGLQGLCDSAAEQVQQITGFDRVMIYRFDEHWHGMVVSEACRNGMDAYLGLHFPASDIPAQARAIFLQNSLRMIPDVDYTPARIHPGIHPQSGAPLDLSRASLRSVSPVHLEYLRNMNVKASLTISLVKDQRLWGLIACHHATPLKINADARVAAELIGHLVSSQLDIKEDAEQREQKANLEQAVPDLLTQLAHAGELAQGFHSHAEDLSAFGAVPAGGVAICYGNEWTLAGATPSVAELEDLLAWINQQFPQQALIHTARLPHEYAAAHAYRNIASGLLAMTIDRSQRDVVLWFRPEVTTTVSWAGEPVKAVRQAGAGVSLHPRASFATWKETVTGNARPWKPIELDAVRQLRSGILGLALQQEYRKEQLARERAERLGREKDEMVAMVSHDLKTPLNVIALSFDYLQRYHPGQEPAVQRMMERGTRAIKLMENLVTNILDVAKLEGGTLDLDARLENPASMIRDVVEMFLPIAQEKDLRLSMELPEDASLQVCCERFRIGQVLGNLIGNALKFTPAGGQVIVAATQQRDEILFSVRDTGEGIHADQLERIFERYWQVGDHKRLGTGLGLWIAKGFVERHHGRIWAESMPGQGSTFYFTLPRASG